MTELKGISKFFSSNRVSALEHANFTLIPGEIHALLGENGAGKSTLMQIMAGYLSPDAGTITVDGKERVFKSPAKALASGVGMVRQHPRQVDGFKVWENCVLGAEKPKSFAAEVSARWGFELDLESPVESLTVSQRQKAAILALLLRGVKYLIFDEPAAVLSPQETETLFELLRRLKEAGRGIVLISHKLDETLGIADRLTVIRDGKTFESMDASSVSAGRLASLIFGGENEQAETNNPDVSADHESGGVPAPSTKIKTAAGPVLSVENLRIEIPGMPIIRNVSFDLEKGKILGIAGIKDSGLETLELAVTGFLKSGGPGKIFLNGRAVNGVWSFRDSGGVYLGADRLGKNLILDAPLKESLIIHAHRRAALGFPGKFGLMNKNFLDSFCEKIMKNADVKRPVWNRAASFSGGMLQRVLLAREFEENASVFVLAGAGLGLDQKNRGKLFSRLKALALSGKSALLFSSSPDELLEVADEILVLRNGSFSARVSLLYKKEAAAREINRAMVEQAYSKAALEEGPR